jgi:hypothetical protein
MTGPGSDNPKNNTCVTAVNILFQLILFTADAVSSLG